MLVWSAGSVEKGGQIDQQREDEKQQGYSKARPFRRGSRLKNANAPSAINNAWRTAPTCV